MEAKLQTAFIFQFAKYIAWKEKQITPESGFRIGVVGASDVFTYLQKLAEEKQIHGVKIKVEKVGIADDLKSYHIIFITNQNLAASVIQKVRGYGVLTVSPDDSLQTQGAVIRFFYENTNLKFEINRKAADEQNLNISSQLLKLARLIE
jgi:hypothetical protein